MMYFGEKQKTMSGIARYAAEKWGGRPAVKFDDRVISYAELDLASDGFAKGLMALGVKKGDRVGIWMHNHPEWVVAWFGASKAGATMVPLDYWYKAGEAQYILWHSGTSVVITSEPMFKVDFLGMINEIRTELPELKHAVVYGELGDRAKNGWMTGFGELFEIGKKVSDAELEARMDKTVESDIHFILYTSGTTGKPKGASLSHRNVILNAWIGGAGLRVTPEDNILVPVPYSHCFGNTLALTLASLRGACQTPMIAYAPAEALRTIEKQKCTLHHGVPTMFIRELEALKSEKFDLSSMRSGFVAGAPCPKEVMVAVREKMGTQLLNVYGQTEASPLITMNRFGDDINTMSTTVGVAIPGVEIRIVDPMTHKEMPCGEQGELACRGHCVMDGGYYKQPDKTAETVDEGGWLYTGDLSVETPYGYYKITGRAKDMVIVGGFNVFPKVIEDHIIRHPKVQDVAVTGAKDFDLGEVVAAAVIPAAGQKIDPVEIVDWCYGEMSSAAVPRYVLIAENLPYSGRGKVQKFKLNDLLNEKMEKGEMVKLKPSKVGKK